MASLGTLLFFLQCQAIFVFSGFFAAWHWAAWRRRVGLRRIERRGTPRTPYCVDFDRDATRDDTDVHLGTRSRRPRHPKVAVVCPVKRFGGETARNWRTQMTSEYGGDLEYVFVAEREADSAVAGFAALMRDMQNEGKVEAEKNGELGAPGTSHAFCRKKKTNPLDAFVGARRARLLVAGSSTSCSQKIHSMLAGALASDEDTTFVLFLDDDIRTHRNTIGVLVRSMTAALHVKNKKRKTPFLTNGFPMDLPSRSSPFANYLTFVYHLVLLIAFSQGEVAKNVWGGCMMLRRESLAKDEHGFVTAYKRGGYSDDLILASACDEHDEIVGCPHEAVFPQRLDETQTLRQWWNYVRRQLFVMDTYANDWNRNVNHGMLFVLTYLSLATTVALVLCGAHLFLFVAARVFFFKDENAKFVHPPPPPTLSFATFFCFALALSAARRMYHDTGKLVAALGDADAFEKVRLIDWKKVALAFFATYAVVPLAAVATLASREVEWAGIRYVKKNGKVTRLESER